MLDLDFRAGVVITYLATQDYQGWKNKFLFEKVLNLCSCAPLGSRFKQCVGIILFGHTLSVKGIGRYLQTFDLHCTWCTVPKQPPHILCSYIFQMLLNENLRNILFLSVASYLSNMTSSCQYSCFYSHTVSSLGRNLIKILFVANKKY